MTTTHPPSLPCTIILPTPPHPHTHTAIFLHGRGDTAPTFARSLTLSCDSHNRTLQQIFPSFRWVFPQAGMRPVEAEGGVVESQWFDIWSLRDMKYREEGQRVGLRESVEGLKGVVREEVRRVGAGERVVLMGISQGCAVGALGLLCLNLGLDGGLGGEKEKGLGEGGNDGCGDGNGNGVEGHTAVRLGAFIGFAGWMALAGRGLAEKRAWLGVEGVSEGDGVLRNTPVLLQHCVDDEVVKMEHGVVLRDELRGFGTSVEWKEYTTGEHWIKSPDGIDDAVAFIRKHLPDVPGDDELVLEE